MAETPRARGGHPGRGIQYSNEVGPAPVRPRNFSSRHCLTVNAVRASAKRIRNHATRLDTARRLVPSRPQWPPGKYGMLIYTADGHVSVHTALDRSHTAWSGGVPRLRRDLVVVGRTDTL